VLKDLFQKKRKYAVIPSDKARREVPEGLMIKCSNCGAIQFSKELEKNLKVCSSCGFHMKLNARERLLCTLDDDSLVEYDSLMISGDPLEFPDYTAKLAKYTEKTGLLEAVVTGEGTIGGFPIVVCVMSFDFAGGSMGSVVGEKITRAIEEATKKRLPLIIFSTSGGARMHEGIISLMQMAKTSSALQRFAEQGNLFISVITDPTSGGVNASFAMLGDLILSEPGAMLGFAGPDVIEQTIGQKLPDNFQTAEFNLRHGQIDMIVTRKEMRQTLAKILDLHAVKEGVSNAG
jgi:acetyl-CoA carboxylase carboxyl transferase subunit beta